MRSDSPLKYPGRSVDPYAPAPVSWAAAIRVLVAVHLLLTVAFSVGLWHVSPVLSTIGDSATTVGRIAVLLVLLGPAPVCSVLAALHAAKRRRRAVGYLGAGAVWNWVQAAATLILGVAAMFPGAALLAVTFTHAAVRLRTQTNASTSTWRTAVLDLAIGLAYATTLTVPVLYGIP